jgi:E3 SUMO-protein ligase RanBP2
VSSEQARLAALERMLAANPQDTRFRFALAVEYLKAERLEDGVRELRAYLADADDEGNAWGRLAGALAGLGRHGEARDALREGIAAANRHGHPTMAEEFAEELSRLDG